MRGQFAQNRGLRRLAGGDGGGAVSPFALVDSGSFAWATGANTISGVNWGADDDARKHVFAVGWCAPNGAASVSSVTIGGTNMNKRVGQIYGEEAAIFLSTFLSPTGTSGDIIVTMSGTPAIAQGLGWCLYRAIGYDSVPAETKTWSNETTGKALSAGTKVFVVPQYGSLRTFTGGAIEDDLLGDPAADAGQLRIQIGRDDGAGTYGLSGTGCPAAAARFVLL